MKTNPAHIGPLYITAKSPCNSCGIELLSKFCGADHKWNQSVLYHLSTFSRRSEYPAYASHHWLPGIHPQSLEKTKHNRKWYGQLIRNMHPAHSRRKLTYCCCLHQIGSSHDSRQKPCHNPAECKQYKSNKTCHMRQHKHCQQIKYTVQNDVSCCSFPLTYKYKSTNGSRQNNGRYAPNNLSPAPPRTNIAIVIKRSIFVLGSNVTYVCIIMQFPLSQNAFSTMIFQILLRSIHKSRMLQ